MSVSFTEAAGRHATDAKLLDSATRTANANQLWGLAAECALKAVLRAVEPTVFEPNGLPRKPYKEHIDKLWPEVIKFFSGRSEAHLAAVLPSANAFALWSVHARYDADKDAPDPETHGAHQRGAQACLLLLEIAGSYGHHE